MITLADAEHRTVAVPGCRLHVALVGEGPPLMLVHGWPEDHRAWRHVVPLLADRYRLILPDLRGFGQSEAPAGDYRKQALADDLLALLDALGVDRLALAGHDWGGFVAFLMALAAPRRFSGVVACNIAHPWMRPPRDPRQLAPLFYMPLAALPVLGPLLLRHTHAVRGLLRGGVARGNRLDDAMIAAYGAMIAEPDRARASSALYRDFLLREVPGLERAFRDRALEIPAAVVYGTQDPAVHVSQVRGLEAHAPTARYTWVEDSGHFVLEERPERVAEAIASFFAEFPP